MSGYSSFAEFYDILMSDVDYKGRAKYLLKLFKKHGKMPTLLLDLACGTGAFSNEMALGGIEVIGIDASEEMLSIARENSADKGTDVLFLCQRAEELDLYGTVDGVICCLDSINHITDLRKLKAAFKKVSLFMEQGSLFIFDVNTPFKHSDILADNTFVIEQDDIFCVWQNEYDAPKGITDISLDFFVKDGEDYKRYSDSFSERVYSFDKLSDLLSEAGLEVEAIYEDMKTCACGDTAERAIFVTRKI